MRNHAYRRVCEDKPFVLVGSPLYTPWSCIQHINDSRMTWDEKEKALAALKKVEEILPREFPGQTETIGLIIARVKKKLATLEQVE